MGELSGLEELLSWLVGFVIRVYTLLDDPKALFLSLAVDLVKLLDFMISEWKSFVPVVVLVRIYYVLKHIAPDFKFFKSSYTALSSQSITTLVELARDVRDMKEKFIKKRKRRLSFPNSDFGLLHGTTLSQSYIRPNHPGGQRLIIYGAKNLSVSHWPETVLPSAYV